MTFCVKGIMYHFIRCTLLLHIHVLTVSSHHMHGCQMIVAFTSTYTIVADHSKMHTQYNSL